jgi:uncharacterized membrane protein
MLGRDLDLDQDGTVSAEDIAAVEKLAEIERQDRKQRAQRRMAWVAMWSMVVFTVVLFSPVISDSRVSALADLLGLFYIAQAGVVGAFMGMSAWMNRK